MSILIDRDTKIVVFGISGKYGSSQTKTMLGYGSKVVAGVTPGKGGSEVLGVPVYDTIDEVLEHHSPDTAIIYVPGFGVLDAAVAAIRAGMRLVMIATEGVPVHDMLRIRREAEEHGCWVLGPNTIGMISPGQCLAGSLAPGYAKPGCVGIVSRGGTITIETIRILSEAGIGQSTAVGAGGDKVLGKNPIDYLRLFEEDPQTKAVVLLGEIGGQKENQCADFIRTMKKPVYAYILGRTAPKGARMGHIGAIISGKGDGFEDKRTALRDAGAWVADTPWQLAEELKKAGYGIEEP